MAKGTIPTSDPVVSEAIALYIIWHRMGYARSKMEVFQFPNKPMDSLKVPKPMQMANAGACGIVLVHLHSSICIPLGKLIDCTVDVFKGRWEEATRAIDEGQVDPLHVQALLERSFAFTQIERVVGAMIQGGMYKAGPGLTPVQIIDKLVKKGDLVSIDISHLGNTSDALN